MVELYDALTEVYLMLVRTLRQSPLFLVSALVLTLALGLIAGFFIGQAKANTVHASGAFTLVIYHGTDLQSCTQSYGCANQTDVCHVEGNSNAIACELTVAPHDGGTIHEDGLACLNVINDEGSYFLTFDSKVTYAPSGQTSVRCVFPDQG